MEEERQPVRDIFKEITDRIICLLEMNIVPWQQPWKSSSLPINLFTGRAYRGINVILLKMAGFPSPYWLTSRQAIKLGGQIKEKEIGVEILFWGLLRAQKESSADVEPVSFMKYYTVFNISQCEGVPIPEENIAVFNSIEECERIISEMPQRPKIYHGSNSASYWPLKDEIRLPDRKAFQIEQEYYCTLFHELCHATGHETRLNRKSIKDVTPFGTPNYSKEELIAEIGAAFLCGLTGIENKTIYNSAAYIQHWLERLNKDKRLIIISAQQAHRAVDFIWIINKEASNDDTGDGSTCKNPLESGVSEDLQAHGE